MLAFECDYNNGAHPMLLRRLAETNDTPEEGYGCDAYSCAAAEKIRAFCGCPDGAVYFLAGGTQTNVVVLSAILAPHEGAVTAETGHIHVHEAGAPEYAGIKTLTLPSHDGKIDAGELSAFGARFYGDEAREHMVFPGAVYLSHPTEYGTLYTKAELSAIAEVCRTYGMRLFLDGAPRSQAAARTFRSATSRSFATCSTSAGRKSARCAAKRSCSRRGICRRILRTM